MKIGEVWMNKSTKRTFRITNIELDPMANDYDVTILYLGHSKDEFTESTWNRIGFIKHFERITNDF